MLTDILDSYFLYFAQQMAVVNPPKPANQQVGSVVYARDWPLSPIQEGIPYLLILNAIPNGGTKAQVRYEFVCQWTWLWIGTDLVANQLAQNRMDRYRSNMALMSYMRQANFPGYCQKQSTSVALSGSSGYLIQTPVTIPYAAVLPPTPYESIWWTELKFQNRQDEASGVLYGTASFMLMGYDDVMLSIA